MELDSKEQSTYKVYSNIEKKHPNNFFRYAFVPFCCSTLGTLLAIGICFGTPSIKSKLLDTATVSSHQDLTIAESPVQHTISLSDYSNTSIAVANKVLPSIVGITVEYKVNTLFGGNSTAQASGSGIIVSEDGYILTNNHVVNTASTSSYYEITEATSVKVKLYQDDTEYEAKVIGTDAQTDLAVIKIEKTGLTAAELGNSDAVQVGEFAMAIGNPLGLQSSISCGIISAKNREVQDSETKTTYYLIQTDAAINSGNSGGALVNADGKVIGINTLKLSGTGIEGIGFAIPINSTLSVYNELKTNGKVARPFIGIGGINVTAALAKQYHLVEGIYIKSIENFSAAEKARLDILTG